MFNNTKNKARIIASLAIFISSLLAMPASVLAQSLLSGIVTDSSGEPLAGVSVVVRDANGSISGTTTDISGNYTIAAGPSSTVEFSCIGFKTLTFSSKQNVSRVAMEEDNQFLDEVVVVGYGTQKKVNLTGAVASVNSEALENRSTNSVTQMLQGAMPNVNIKVNTGAPGAGGTITIRGTG